MTHFILGAVFGGTVGILTMALLVAEKRGGKYEDE